MLFNKVTKQHILQGIKDFEEKGYPDGFGPSTTYNVVYNSKNYPPPSIMAYAYYHAEGKTVEPNFKVGKGSECFKVYERFGFLIEKKNLMNKEDVYWREAIIEAFTILNHMDEKDINKSTAYDVEYKGKYYPPKEVFRLAADFIAENHPEIDIPNPSGGKPTNKFIEKYGFKVFNREYQQMTEEIKGLLASPYFQGLLSSDIFYLSKLSELFKQYNDFDLKLIKTDIETYLSNEPENFSFKELIDNSKGDFNSFFKLVGNLISIFDEKGYNKNIWNPYQDKRVVSRSMLSQKYWTENLLKYKLLEFNDDYIQNKAAEAFKHSINFINQPNLHVNIVSKNHRKDIVNYFKLDKDSEIIDLFSNELKGLKTELNKGVIVSQLLYNPEIKKIWLTSVTGLMASDSTGWFDGFVKESSKHKYSIVWNSKKPSGRDATLKALRKVIDEDGSFNLFYCSNKKVNYAAKIVDFAEDNQDYQNKNWKSTHKVIYGSNSLFSEYSDGKKKASIVFLCESFNKIKPIDRNEFEVFKNYSYPTQDNLTPLQSEPEINIIERIPDDNDIAKSKKEMKSKAPLNQILFGPPGTGKTFNTINKAIKIINPLFDFTQKRKVVKAEFERLVNEKQIVFSTFHQSMSYEDFVEGIKPITKDGNVTYEVKDGIFKNICHDAELYSLDRQSSVSKKVDLENRIKKLKDELEQAENSEIEISMTNKSYHITSISDKHIKFRKASGGTGHDLVIDSLKGIALGEKELIGGLRGYYDYLINHLKHYLSNLIII